MFRSNFKCLLFSILLLSPLIARTEVQNTSGTTSTHTSIYKNYDSSSLAFSYISWKEFVDLKNGATTDTATADYYGNAISYSRETYENSQKSGRLFEGSLIYGRASVGGSQSLITYQEGLLGWWGFDLSYRYAYRLSPQISLSAGPRLLNRQIKFPNSTAGAEATAGAQFNLGALVDLRLRLSPDWELRQSIGTLMTKASTIWTVGLGYKF